MLHPKSSCDSLSRGNSAKVSRQVDRSEKEISKLGWGRTSTRERWKKTREWLFLVYTCRRLPLYHPTTLPPTRVALACTRSIVFGAPQKGPPNTPHPEPTSTLPTSLLRPLLRSKMKIGWCSRKIRRRSRADWRRS